MSNIKCAWHEQRYTQTDMEEFDRIALERKNYVATPEEGPLLQRWNYTGRTTQSRRMQQHRRDQRTLCTVENGNSRSRCRKVVIVVIMDMVTFDKVFLVGLFLIIANYGDSHHNLLHLTSQHTS